MSIEHRVSQLVEEVAEVDTVIAAAARRRHQGLLKPPGSLGALEELSVTLAAIAGINPPPPPSQPAVIIAAGDHGVHAQGVTPWPQSITATMVEMFCAGKAAVNAIAAAVGAQISVLDVGVANPVADHPLLRKARVRSGTADLTQGPAMTTDEAAQALLAGAGLAEELVGAGVDLFVTGDMGIANTTASACLIAAFTGREAAEVTGRGAGIDDATLRRKIEVVRAAVERHFTSERGIAAAGDPLSALAAVGGLEHAALVGVILSAAADGLPVVLDGVTAGAAALVAVALCPAASGYLVAGHRSAEPGASAALEHLKLDPVIDLGLRLGEGTGGLLAVPIVQASARALGEMGALADVVAGVGVEPDGA